MAKYPSTILPQKAESVDIQKSTLDLLDKINRTNDDMTIGLNTTIKYTFEVAYTPTFTGFGTVSAVSFSWVRCGNRLKVIGKFTSGIISAVEARISLPGSLVSDSVLVPSLMVCGIMCHTNVGVEILYCLIESGVGYITLGRQTAANGALNKINGNLVGATGEIFALQFELPISGWNI